MAGQRLTDRDALLGADFANDDLVLVFDLSANTTKKMTRAELLTSISGVLPNGDKGDITVSGSGTTWTIDNNVVTYAKMQDVSAQYRLLGRSSSGAGDVEEITSSANVFSILGAADYASVRTLLSLVPGTDVQSYSAILAAFAGAAAASDKLPYFTGASTVGVTDFTSFGRSLVDDANASAARTTLGLVIGTDVQAYSANTAAIAALTSAADKVPYFTGSGTAAVADFTAAGRAIAGAASALAQSAIILPAGVIVPYAGSSAPTGWLLCYGQAVSRSTYSALFSAISTTYGAGDGSTTFNLPDLRGRAVAGKDDMGGSAASRLTNSGTGNPGINGATLGAAGGSDRHTLTTAQLAAHNHGVTDPGHYHATDSANVYSGGAPMVYTGDLATNGQNDGTGNRITSVVGSNISIQNNGSGQAHPIVQPTMVLNYIIFAGA